MSRRAYAFFLTALLLALPLAAYTQAHTAPADITVQPCTQYDPHMPNTRHDVCMDTTGTLVNAAPYTTENR